MDTAARAREIVVRLRALYPDPEPALVHSNAYELLVATVLAAQCTDARVNTVTPEFFRRWPDPASLARADVAQVEDVVHSTGFFRQKAKNLVAAAKLMAERHGGGVPDSMATLTTLPGVARKTANIVLSNALGKNEGIAVDTHVRRLAFRLGLTVSTNPIIIEKDMMLLLSQEDWGIVNHLLVLHGRAVCKARKPRCDFCVLGDICPRLGL
ncbi:endonuclease III [Solidesulfovibrio carbinoliphilus subsp. oakridgensis]|uniref:Endonuclease III n=1 Tax=Solidesulfovibrio carbinoliphilus subsp. oakridgensis TaxID=694327 RepID=G7Q5W1_9BACT|nr:endonuclease III [Solidesulfovibrio carbinoliphilus]EHJ46898.1 endonuclease III [Solidesulfovibrio carbinoliphilus subsp. oakridgensis]